ncbi:MAG: hypothetical protein COA78_24350 [Blastopirellula sp.]|nr:MAG: hypothetical protein COA78_24350 [Blastopirellula sp.]
MPGANQDHLLDDHFNVIKNHSVIWGDGEAIEATKKAAAKEGESSALPDEYLKRLDALSLSNEDKDKVEKILIDATAEQKEVIINQLELRYSEVKQEVVKQEDSKNEVIENFIERLKKTSTVTDVKLFPPVTSPGTSRTITSEQVSKYPITQNQDTNYLKLLQEVGVLIASKIPVANRSPNEAKSRSQFLAYHQDMSPSAKSEIALASGIMPEDLKLRNAGFSQYPLSLNPAQRNENAKRKESQSTATNPMLGDLDNAASQLTPDQLLVMEVVWNRGEISFQNIFREINPSSMMAKSTDTPDGGLTSTTNVRPPLLTRDEIQAVIYELVESNWLEHQFREGSNNYWATRNRPTQLSQSWKETLATTIRRLETTAKGKRLSQAEQSQLKIYLRMLYLMAQRKTDAVEKVKGLSTAEQDFWANLMFGMADYLQETGMSDEQRNLLALRSIRRAVNSLSETSPLDVHNLHFIESVESYGRFKEFPNTQFKPNQEVLLYAEIDNLTATQVDGEFHSTLLSTYEIFDKAGQRIDYRKFPEVKDTCSTQRRDFYVPYRLYIPENLTPGDYVLELTVRDVDSNKFGEASIDFTVTP